MCFNILILSLKLIKLMRQIFSILIVTAVMNSCSEHADDPKTTGTGQAKPGQQAGADSKLVYLDTAENVYNILCQGWVLEEDAEGLEGMTESSKFEIPYRSFYLSTQGSFVKNPRNTFDYGNWTYDETAKTITINNTIDRNKDVYKIAKIASDELTLVNVGVNSTTNLKFIAPGKRFKNANEEPFFLENNRWRIKQKTKETDSGVHQRLKENIHFFITYYKDVLAKNENIVSFWGLPSCFKWYGGGIFIKKENELNENWIACFYNREQAMQAYRLAEKLLEQKYTWPKDEQNWLKLNLAVLEQMYKKIDEIR